MLLGGFSYALGVETLREQAEERPVVLSWCVFFCFCAFSCFFFFCGKLFFVWLLKGMLKVCKVF